MRTFRLLAFFTAFSFACLTSSTALALKVRAVLSPQNAERAGFNISIKPPSENGTVKVVVTRDLSKARVHPPESDLTVLRSAQLRVVGAAGVLVSCRLAPSPWENTVTYSFNLSPELAAQAQLSITEDDDYKNRDGRPSLLGFGTHYEIPLKAFLAR